MSKVIYVVGSGRSGSTMLDLALSSHYNITGLGEVHRLSLNPNQRNCGCGKKINQCEFWSKTIKEVCLEMDIDFDKWEDSFPTTEISRRIKIFGYSMPSLIDLIAVYWPVSSINWWRLGFIAKKFIDNSWFLYDKISKNESTEFVVDSSKNALRAKLLYFARPNDVYFIHLVRDGRAIIESAIRRNGTSVEDISKEWRRVNSTIDLILKNVPEEQQIMIKYEDFCQDPNKTLEKIYKVISPQSKGNGFKLESLLDFTPHQIPGNPLLKNKISGINLNESWKEKLSESQLNVFNKIAGDTNEKYGYKR